MPPAMLRPANGATGVADGKFTLVLAAPYGTSTQLVATSGKAMTLASTTLARPPSGASPMPGRHIAAYAVPALAPATTYTVQAYFAPTTSPACAAGTVKLGSFTTQ